MTSPLARPRWRPAAALGFVAVASVAFAALDPPVGDFWAARARQYAATHGVGLHYWFGWFGGLIPGHYSLLVPYVMRFLDVGVLAAVATVGTVLATHRLVRGSPHPAAATWAAAVGMSFSLWSGRVPFAVGSLAMVIALIAVRERRPVAALTLAGLTAAISPVSGTFLALGLVGVIVHDRERRRPALAGFGAALLALLGEELYFGLPGPEGFLPVQATAAIGALVVMLVARPEPRLRTVLVTALMVCPLIILVPNGMGSNFERFTWICLPVAVLAGARAPLRVAVPTCGLALAFGVIGSSHDLYVAAQPMSRPSYTAALVRAIDTLPARADHRLEVVPDGSHVVAFTLLGHATLARGYETQTDNEVDAGLFSASLDARGYRQWLDDHAVGWVAIDRVSLKSGPEDTLVRHHRPAYLVPVWSDAHWLLYAVARATPIVAAPGHVVDAEQARVSVWVPAGDTLVRIRWSRFLHLAGSSGARLSPAPHGWVELHAAVAGTYVLA